MNDSQSRRPKLKLVKQANKNPNSKCLVQCSIHIYVRNTIKKKPMVSLFRWNYYSVVTCEINKYVATVTAALPRNKRRYTVHIYNDSNDFDKNSLAIVSIHSFTTHTASNKDNDRCTIDEFCRFCLVPEIMRMMIELRHKQNTLTFRRSVYYTSQIVHRIGYTTERVININITVE